MGSSHIFCFVVRFAGSVNTVSLALSHVELFNQPDFIVLLLHGNILSLRVSHPFIGHHRILAKKIQVVLSCAIWSLLFKNGLWSSGCVKWDCSYVTFGNIVDLQCQIHSYLHFSLFFFSISNTFSLLDIWVLFWDEFGIAADANWIFCTAGTHDFETIAWHHQKKIKNTLSTFCKVYN